MSFPGFPRDTLDFLTELQEHNHREWFAKHKARYEASVVAPALELISSLEKPLLKVAPMLRVEAKKMGGSLMRIYKDTRFSKDKTPYKTNIGIQFRHQLGRDVHAPGVYLHIDPAECFLGVGTWRPPADALRQIRDDIAANADAWKRAWNNTKFQQAFTMYEDRLKTAPRGYDRSHPMIDALRQQSFIGMAPLSRKQIEGPELGLRIPKLIAAGKPLMLRLCEALQQPW